MPDHPAVLNVVEETKRLINELGQQNITGQKQWNTGEKGFIGWRKCLDCHPAQTAKWQGTRHASAFLTLVEKKQQFNQECLPCHVTGADRLNPADSLMLNSDLQVVGCESCHGPGLAHLGSPATVRTAPVVETACLNCHTTEQDDSFNFATDLKKLKCP